MGSKSSSIGCWYWPTTALQASIRGPWQPSLVVQAVLDVVEVTSLELSLSSSLVSEAFGLCVFLLNVL